MAATMLHGRKGIFTTIRQVGVTLLWPAGIAFVAAVTAFALMRAGGAMNHNMALVAATLRILALIWAAGATIFCIKMLHGFGWGKAIVAFFISFTMMLLLTVVVMFIMNVMQLSSKA